MEVIYIIYIIQNVFVKSYFVPFEVVVYPYNVSEDSDGLAIELTH